MNEKKNKIICGNCGKIGHIYKNCKFPVMSLGIIAFKYENSSFKYLLIRRKDTLGFVEFLRGKYNINDRNYILNLFKEMTQNEVKRILSNDFDTLWKQLWMEQSIKYFKNDYEKSKKRFNSIKNNPLIKIVDIIKDVKTFWDEPEWGFPKGRRNIRETDIDCASREFIEETGYNIEDISILKNLDPIQEQFYGSNNVEYKHIYFVAKFNGNKKPYINQNNKDQISEISKIGWFTYEEAISMIRPYNVEKKNVLNSINNLLERIILKDIDQNMLFIN